MVWRRRVRGLLARRMDLVPTAEAGLLVQAARPGATEPAPPLARAVDWSALRSLALAHKVGPLLRAALRRWALPDVPSALLQELDRDAVARIQFSLRYTAELHRVVAALHAAQIPVIAHKGPLFAHAVYGGVERRAFADLDLLVGTGRADAALDELTALGYEVRRDWGFQIELRRGNVTVDLHRRVVPDHFGLSLDFEPLFQSSTPAQLGPLSVRVPSPEHCLVLLAAEIMRDALEGRLRLQKLADVQHLSAVSGVDLAAARREARALGCVGLVEVALDLGQIVMGGAAPRTWLAPLLARRLFGPDRVDPAGHVLRYHAQKLVLQLWASDAARGRLRVVGDTARAWWRR